MNPSFSCAASDTSEFQTIIRSCYFTFDWVTIFYLLQDLPSLSCGNYKRWVRFVSTFNGSGLIMFVCPPTSLVEISADLPLLPSAPLGPVKPMLDLRHLYQQRWIRHVFTIFTTMETLPSIPLAPSLPEMDTPSLPATPFLPGALMEFKPLRSLSERLQLYHL